MSEGIFLDGDIIRKYWNKKVALIPNQSLLSSPLPTANELISSFSGSLISDKWTEPLDVAINASIVNEDGSHSQLLGVDFKTARNCFMRGFSLCFGDLSSHIEKLATLKAEAVEVFSYPELIAVTGYLSPPKTSSVLHFDRQHNFFIQREGAKRWYVSDMAGAKNPHENLIYSGLAQSFFDGMQEKGYNIALPRDCGRAVYELNPGDVLYVPPGFYHSAETLVEPSLHYTLTIEPACFWKDFRKNIFATLLASDGRLFADYRFLSKLEKEELFRDCFNLIVDQHK